MSNTIEPAHQDDPRKNLKYDLPAGVVVFLVAMPLCLGIALASGAPLFSGLIAGMVGGLVVGTLSGSPLGVSGPAAGLAVIVLNAITDLGSFDIFLCAVIVGGLFQLALGFLKAGIVAYYFPSSVINGMLAGIGVIIILKQIPHGVGYDSDPEGDLSFVQPDQHNTFSELLYMFDGISWGPLLITIVCLGILILWNLPVIKRIKALQLVQGPLVAVCAGMGLQELFQGMPSLALNPDQMVQIPVSSSMSDFFGQFSLPNFSGFLNPQVWLTGAVLAVVGSLETLLCVEASDKQDPQRRVTPTNRELTAQGVGNIVSGLVGGLPVTQVIVRSSVNVQAGGRTKASAIFHGFLILISLLLIPGLLNKIPLASLAAILFVVGFKLARPSLFVKMKSQGLSQFLPFVTTIVAIVFTDLLTGIGLGFAVAIFFILYQNFQIPIIVEKELEKEGKIEIELTEDVSFLKKASLLKALTEIPDGRTVVINASKTYYIHQDVIDIIENFKISAQSRNITVELIELYDHKTLDPMLHFKVKH